jgi:hypothetical protein
MAIRTKLGGKAVVAIYWHLPGVTEREKKKKKTISMGQAVFCLRFEQNTNL